MNDEIKQTSRNSENPLSEMTTAMARPVVPDYRPMENKSQNPAKWTYERLSRYIKDFEARLDEEHEIGARLVSFGSAVTFHIQDMSYYEPDIIAFYGKNDQGEEVQLIQHTSQLSVLLVAVKKQGDEPRRIGFVLDEKEKDHGDTPGSDG